MLHNSWFKFWENANCYILLPEQGFKPFLATILFQLFPDDEWYLHCSNYLKN